jgi:hypothetical protein
VLRREPAELHGLREDWRPEGETLQWSFDGELIPGADPYGVFGVYEP